MGGTCSFLFFGEGSGGGFIFFHFLIYFSSDSYFFKSPWEGLISTQLYIYIPISSGHQLDITPARYNG